MVYSDPAEPDVSANELKRLCQEYLARLQVSDNLYQCLCLSLPTGVSS